MLHDAQRRPEWTLHLDGVPVHFLLVHDGAKVSTHA